MTSTTKRSRITIVPKKLKREETNGAFTNLSEDVAKGTADNRHQEHPETAQAKFKPRTEVTTERRVARASSQKPSSARLNPILETPVSQAGTPSKRSRLNPIRIPAKSAADEQIADAVATGSRKRKTELADYKANDKRHKASDEHGTSRQSFATKTVVSEQGENIPPRRTAAQQRAAMKREAELEKNTTLEYAEKTIMEHEKILSFFPTPAELQRQEERFAKLEESIEMQFKENERLRYENAMLTETIAKVELKSIQLMEEVCDLKHHFGLSPLKYRRRDDAHGRPFGNWRRIPSNAEHIPTALDTEKAERNRHLTNKKLPLLTVSLDPSEPENRSSIEEVDAIPERSSLKRPREGRPSCSPPQPAGDSALSFQHSTTSTKREREGHSGDSVLNSPPPKRIREKGGALQLLVLPEVQGDGDGASHELSNMVSPVIIMKDVEQAYIQACIDGGWDEPTDSFSTTHLLPPNTFGYTPNTPRPSSRILKK